MKMLRTERSGICIENDPYDRGYWARYNGFPRPDRKGARRDGWDACDEELRDERSLAVQRGWDTRRQGPHRLAPAGLAALREGRDG